MRAGASSEKCGIYFTLSPYSPRSIPLTSMQSEWVRLLYYDTDISCKTYESSTIPRSSLQRERVAREKMRDVLRERLVDPSLAQKRKRLGAVQVEMEHRKHSRRTGGTGLVDPSLAQQRKRLGAEEGGVCANSVFGMTPPPSIPYC